MGTKQNTIAQLKVNAEDLTEKANVDEANTLLIEGRRGLADTSRGTLVAGRAYNKLKTMFKKGAWLPWLAVEGTRTGHSIRSIQQYMKAAKEADAENEKLRVLPKATDAQAVAIRTAGAQAAQRVADAITATDLRSGTAEPRTKKPPRKSPPRLDGMYHLPLNMTGAEKDATDQLVASPKWPIMEAAIMAFLRRLHAAARITRKIATIPDVAKKAVDSVPGFVPGYVATDADVPSIIPTEAGDAAHTSA